MILKDILESTERRVAAISEYPAHKTSHRPKSLKNAISAAVAGNAIIGELKYASPSTGFTGNTRDPEDIADDLITGGCIALSVLTEPDFFGGSATTLEKLGAVSPVPILRKDFIIDDRQVYETKALGADAILLIARILDTRLRSFISLSRKLGLDPLVEVHTIGDVRLACSSGADLIGINNRNLVTMKTDLGTTRRLSPILRQEGVQIVSMSGICTSDDIHSLKGICDAFLIGSALMRSEDPKTFLEELIFA